MNGSASRLLGAVLAILASLSIFAACSGGEKEAATTTPTAAAFPVTVTDTNGKEVTFEAAPKRIVALAPSFVEVLFSIGAGDALVAVDENTNFPPEAHSLTKISGFQPSVEGIAAQKPDLVTIFYDPGGLQEALERLGVRVLFLKSPASVQGVFEQIELLGRATGHLTQAKDLVADMKAKIDAVTQKVRGVKQGPKVFHELSPDLYTASEEDFVGDLYTTLKAQNIAAGAGPFPQLTQEAVISANPEVIILADEPAVTVEDVKARPGWENVSAVKNGHIYTVDPDIVSRPGPRLIEALETLAKLLYPET